MTGWRDEARAQLRCTPVTAALVRSGETCKGDMMGPAELAGVTAPKPTATPISLRRPLLLNQVVVEIGPDDSPPGFAVSARVRASGRTGVEMEALTGVSVACPALLGMPKAVDQTMQIGAIRVVAKVGGRSGAWSG